MRALTLLEKLVTGAVIIALMALVFGASVATADVPSQGSTPEDTEVYEPEPSVYWVLFARGSDNTLHRFAYVDEEGCRATEQKAIEEPTIIESSGCVRVELKIKERTQ